MLRAGGGAETLLSLRLSRPFRGLELHIAHAVRPPTNQLCAPSTRASSSMHRTCSRKKRCCAGASRGNMARPRRPAPRDRDSTWKRTVPSAACFTVMSSQPAIKWPDVVAYATVVSRAPALGNDNVRHGLSTHSPGAMRAAVTRAPQSSCKITVVADDSCIFHSSNNLRAFRYAARPRPSVLEVSWMTRRLSSGSLPPGMNP